MSNQVGVRPTCWSFRLLCLSMAGLTACSTGRPQYVWHDLGVQGQRDPGKAPPPLLENWGADAESVYSSDPVIAPGFLVSIESLSDRKITGDYRVDFDGTLQLPYDISLNTSGLTLSQLKKKLIALYRPYFKTSPDMDVRVKERRFSLDVRGLVQKPGRYLVEQNMSVDQIITLAGGMDKDTPPQFVRVQKGSKLFILDMNQYYAQGEAQPKILGWLGGEVVFFQREIGDALGGQTSGTAYRTPMVILGEVRKPGEYPVKPGSDFVDSLIMANGFTDMADLDRIEVIRRSGGRKRVYEFSWNEFQRAPTPAQGDVVLVHADRSAHVDRKIQIAAILVSILTSAAIVYELDRTNNR